MSFGVDSIGYNPYANDSAFLYALNSYNPNFMGAQFSQYAQYLQAAQQAAAQDTTTTTTTTPVTDPTFKGSDYGSAKSSDGPGIGTALAVAGGAAALIIAGYKGKGNPIKGIEKIWNSLKSKGASITGEGGNSVASKISNLIKNGGKNLQEYTIQKEGMSFVMKDGKPIKIITQDKKVIDKAKDVTDWLRKNPSVRSEINGLGLNGTTLPKGVSLSYTREIADGKNFYRMIVENGKVVKAASKDKSGKWVDVAENQFEGFIKNHAKQVKEAETLQKTLYGKKVQVLNSKGKLVSQNGNIQLNVRNGEVVSAKFNGRDMKPEELTALGKDFKTEIERFGHENGFRYGLSNYGFVYRKKGGQTIRFDKGRNITNVTAVTEKEIKNSDAIKSWLEKNEGIKSELDNIASSGAISEGFRLGNVVYKDDSGRVFEIIGDKIKGLKLNEKITLCGKTFKAGDLINGKYLAEWRKTAENGNAYNVISELLK